MNPDSVITGSYGSKTVMIDGKIIDPLNSRKVREHSPDGFNWSYGGSGPAQLALAILLEMTDERTALKHYQDFKWAFISHLPPEDFTLSVNVVEDWLLTQTLH